MPSGLRAVHGGPVLTAVNATQSRPTARFGVQRDHQTRGFQVFEGTPNAGQAQVSLPIPQNDEHYLVEIITLTSNSSNQPTAGLYIATAGDPQNLVDYTPDGGLAVAYEIPAILVPPGQTFSVLWSGLSSGASCTARLQWRVMANLTAGGQP